MRREVDRFGSVGFGPAAPAAGADAALALPSSPLTKVKLINELNAREAELGVQEAVSWHAEYKDSAWIFIGGLPYELTEGDVICVFSQYGEIVNINLVRDKKTGKSKGFCFLCYEDQRSTILAVDNFNGIKIKGRTIRVDHVANYRPPKDSDDLDDITRTLHAKGCGVKTPPHTSSDSMSEDEELPVKKQKDQERSREERPRPSSRAGKRTQPGEEEQPRVKIKKEKEDPGYERYAGGSQPHGKGSERKPGSRPQREEEERRHRRPSPERRGEKRAQEQRGHGGWREERERREEAGRRGEGHGRSREECPKGGRSRECGAREPHSRHGEQRGSARGSTRS
ncbi:RNA-binding motif protein, X-linked 2 [Calypte anna]|uniref:RNA-binding motif protein, X-linked 2 n=1 Tax=Calypte anna TaxID=9244 RepID=UPI0011C3FE05|nr:RNA-binding motif protein, X-linked 2 [Calypte anna]